MRECFFILFFWQVFFCAIGQNTRIPYVQKKDSQEPVRFLSVASLDSQVQVKIKTESFDSIKSLIPTSKDLQVIFDSLSIEQSSIMVQMKFAYLLQNLKKQHKRLIEQAELSRFNLKNMQFVWNLSHMTKHQQSIGCSKILSPLHYLKEMYGFHSNQCYLSHSLLN